MDNYKIRVNGTHPKAYQEILDVASELGYANEDWGNLYNVNYLFLNDDGSVGFSLNGESVSDDYQEITLSQLQDLVAQSKNKQGLISGADALRALADREAVEVKRIHDSEWQPAQIFGVSVFTDSETTSFRLKPRTIKLELEIPAPFEPKVGETYYFITTSNSQGFDFTEFDDSDGDKLYMQLGAYKTVSDARKAVAALRGIKG